MKYLGSISGRGVLQHNGIAIAKATYELEDYLHPAGGVIGSGEIGLKLGALQAAIEQTDIQLLTGDNHLLNIKFSDKKIRVGEHIHVDVSGELLAQEEWRH